MTMDWANERYVKIYTRNTAEWLCLAWQGRALWGLLIRAADRSGVIETRLGAKGLAALVALPIEVVEPGLESLLDDGCVKTHRLGFVIPNYIEAQEAIQSGPQRTREWRERERIRRRDDAKHDETYGDEDERNVTDARRNVTETRRGVTHGDAARRDETPSLADPSRAEKETERAEMREAPGEPSNAGAARLRVVPSGDTGTTPRAEETRTTQMAGSGGHAKAPPKPKPQPPVEADMQARLLYEAIVANDPEGNAAKAPAEHREAVIDDWADVIRKMHAHDRLSYGDIQAMVSWAHRHTFWRTVITSAARLRKHWNEMAQQRRTRTPVIPAPQDPKRAAAERRAAIERERQHEAEQRAAAERDREEVKAVVAELAGKLAVAPA
jgi:hypothetical protein